MVVVFCNFCDFRVLKKLIVKLFLRDIAKVHAT